MLGSPSQVNSLATANPPGTIALDGRPVDFHNPQEAQLAGVSTIYQEINLVPHRSVAENIFLGEFGSFGKHPTLEDRCRHAAAVYSALGRLEIPNAWWEWDGGFNMFERGRGEISDCMRKAIDSYKAQK